MYDTMGVSQISLKWNFVFRLNTILYRIRLYVPQEFGKNDTISPHQQVLKYILCFLDVCKVIFHFTLSI